MHARAHGQPPYRVVVVHGGPGAAGDLFAVARHLATGRGVLEPMQTAASVAGQVSELTTHIERQTDPPVILIGHSWGAWLAALVAAEHPDLVRKLILVGSGAFEEKYVPMLRARRMERHSHQRVSSLTTPTGAISSSRSTRVRPPSDVKRNRCPPLSLFMCVQSARRPDSRVPASEVTAIDNHVEDHLDRGLDDLSSGDDGHSCLVNFSIGPPNRTHTMNP